MADEPVCELCGGAGRYVQAIAYENEHEPGGVHDGVLNILCHGCNGSGKQHERQSADDADVRKGNADDTIA